MLLVVEVYVNNNNNNNICLKSNIQTSSVDCAPQWCVYVFHVCFDLCVVI